MLTVYSESGRGLWKEGIASIDPDGDCRPGEHGKIVIKEQTIYDCYAVDHVVTGGATAQHRDRAIT
jgi:hypothetical protein